MDVGDVARPEKLIMNLGLGLVRSCGLEVKLQSRRQKTSRKMFGRLLCKSSPVCQVTYSDEAPLGSQCSILSANSSLASGSKLPSRQQPRQGREPMVLFGTTPQHALYISLYHQLM